MLLIWVGMNKKGNRRDSFGRDGHVLVLYIHIYIRFILLIEMDVRGSYLSFAYKYSYPIRICVINRRCLSL